MKKVLRRLQKQLTFALALQTLIVLQLAAGILMILFYNAWLGLLLFGNAALIHLSREVLRQLSGLRELLTYALFKRGKSSEVRPHEPESASRPTRRPVAAHGD